MNTMKTKKLHNIFWLDIALGILLIISAFILSIRLGAKDIDVQTIIDSIKNFDENSLNHNIIKELRLPRGFASILVGASFGMAGALIQGITRNPMASPSILGINSGAIFAISLAFIIFTVPPFKILIIFSFIGASLAGLIVYGISSIGLQSPLRLILAGVSISALFTALAQGLAIYFKVAKEITYWSSGAIAGVTLNNIKVMLPIFIIGFILAIIISIKVSILNLGEEIAINLGEDIRKIKVISMLAMLLLSSASVALVGPIGFIGLVVPHISKFFVGVNYFRITILSGIIGALILLISDILSRIINPPFETPIGIITSFLAHFIQLALIFICTIDLTLTQKTCVKLIFVSINLIQVFCYLHHSLLIC